ncbi:hypothetical protein COC96_23430 [Bacillus cereus]|nr:hypothetical protein COC96_23430 [Bacillus cereus]
MYVVNDGVIYRKVRLNSMKFGTSNDEDAKITGLKQAPRVFLPIPQKGGIRQNIPNYILSYSSANECSYVNLVKISSSLMFSMIVSKFTIVGDLLNS